MNPVNNKQQPPSAISDDQAHASGSASRSDLPVPDDNANVSPALQLDESRGAIRKIIPQTQCDHFNCSGTGIDILLHVRGTSSCYSLSPLALLSRSVNCTAGQSGGPKTDTVMERNWSGERRHKNKTPTLSCSSIRKHIARKTDSKCLPNDSSSSSSSSDEFKAEFCFPDDEQIHAAHRALGYSRDFITNEMRLDFYKNSKRLYERGRQMAEDQSNETRNETQETCKKKKESSSSSSSSAKEEKEEETFGSHRSRSFSSSSNESVSDIGVYYKYIQEADLPPALYNTIQPAPAADNNMGAANVQAENNRQENSSPEPMDYLEMDFDPGQSGDADSDSAANAPEKDGGDAHSIFAQLAAMPPTSTGQNNSGNASRSSPPPPLLPPAAPSSRIITGYDTLVHLTSLMTYGMDQKCKQIPGNGSEQQRSGSPQAGPSRTAPRTDQLMSAEEKERRRSAEEMDRPRSWASINDGREATTSSAQNVASLEQKEKEEEEKEEEERQAREEMVEYYLDSDTEGEDLVVRRRRSKDFDAAVGASRPSRRLSPELDRCGLELLNNVLDASYGVTHDGPAAGPTEVASTTPDNGSSSSPSKCDMLLSKLSIMESVLRTAEMLNTASPLRLEIMLWTEEHINLRANFPNSRDGRGSTVNAIRDCIKTLNAGDVMLPSEAQVLHVLDQLNPPYREVPVADLVSYLRSRSGAGFSHRHIIEALDVLTKSQVYARFFPLYPKPNVELQEWLKMWMWRGVVPIVTTTNFHKYRPGCTPEEDYWCHRLAYGAGSRGILMNDPQEFVGKTGLKERLAHESIVEVKSSEVMRRYNTKTDFDNLLELEKQRKFWRDSHILGQVMNLVRENRQTHPRSHKTPTVRIPTHLKAGITLVVPTSNRVAYEALLNHPESPTLEKITCRSYPQSDANRAIDADLFPPRRDLFKSGRKHHQE